MARPRSEQRQNSILAAAIELIAEQGLGASTADIARRAGVPHGSIFTYFETKAALLNAAYVELKTDLSETILRNMPAGAGPRAQLEHLWLSWIDWGLQSPHKRRALAQLGVSDQIDADSRSRAAEVAAPATAVVYRVSDQGALGAAPPAYVGALVETLIGTTIDYLIAARGDAKSVRSVGFEALWRSLN
jgi:AcrR family transcriptional regulator